MGIDTNNTITSNTSYTKTASSQSIMGKDDFLRIFVEQLKNQDPLKPLDDKEFIAQMAQFSSLEQLSNISQSAESLLDFQTNMTNDLSSIKESLTLNNLSMASSLIGKTGYWLDQNGKEASGQIQSLILKNQQYFAEIDGNEVMLGDLQKVGLGIDTSGSNI